MLGVLQQSCLPLKMWKFTAFLWIRSFSSLASDLAGQSTPSLNMMLPNAQVCSLWGCRSGQLVVETGEFLWPLCTGCTGLGRHVGWLLCHQWYLRKRPNSAGRWNLAESGLKVQPLLILKSGDVALLSAMRCGRWWDMVAINYVAAQSWAGTADCPPLCFAGQQN